MKLIWKLGLVALPLLGATAGVRAADQTTTEEWIDVFSKGEDPAERVRAAQELASGARAAKRALFRALTDEDEGVREAARATLAEFGVEASPSWIFPAERRGPAYVWTKNEGVAPSAKGKQCCQTALATDVGGRVWLSYLDCDYRPIHDGRSIAWPRRVMLLSSSDAGRTFSHHEPLAQTGGDQALAVSESGDLFASWAQYTEKGSQLKHWVVVQRIGKDGLRSHLRAPLPLNDEMRQFQADVHVAPDGTIWVLGVDTRDGRARCARSPDGGENYPDQCSIDSIGAYPQIVSTKLGTMAVGSDGYFSFIGQGGEFLPRPSISGRRFGDKLARVATDPDGQRIHVVGDSRRAGLLIHTTEDLGRTWRVVRADDGRPVSAWRYPAIHVDAEGAVHVVWMDDRDGQGAVHHTVSTDGCETFSTISRVSDTPFPFPALAPPPPPATQDGSWIGRYMSITSVGDEVVVAWSDQRTGPTRSSVYTAVGARGE